MGQRVGDRTCNKRLGSDSQRGRPRFAKKGQKSLFLGRRRASGKDITRKEAISRNSRKV
jgi:hypothetical protein